MSWNAKISLQLFIFLYKKPLHMEQMRAIFNTNIQQTKTMKRKSRYYSFVTESQGGWEPGTKDITEVRLGVASWNPLRIVGGAGGPSPLKIQGVSAVARTFWVTRQAGNWGGTARKALVLMDGSLIF